MAIHLARHPQSCESDEWFDCYWRVPVTDASSHAYRVDLPGNGTLAYQTASHRDLHTYRGWHPTRHPHSCECIWWLPLFWCAVLLVMFNNNVQDMYKSKANVCQCSAGHRVFHSLHSSGHRASFHSVTFLSAFQTRQNNGFHCPHHIRGSLRFRSRCTHCRQCNLCGRHEGQQRRLLRLYPCESYFSHSVSLLDTDKRSALARPRPPGQSLPGRLW